MKPIVDIPSNINDEIFEAVNLMPETIDSTISLTNPTLPRDRKTLTIASFLIGFGLGGMLDGITLHMLLQWHHILSNHIPADTLDGLQHNMVIDGVFNLVMLLIMVVGLFMLWQVAKRDAPLPQSTQAFMGWIVAGWGGFHMFDSIVFHTVLRVHHIRDVPNFLVYDIGFFVVGLILILVGLLLIRRDGLIGR